MTVDPAPASQADSAAPPQVGASDASPADAVETISLDEAKKLRQEAAALRRRLKDTEAKLQERDDADLSAQERLQKRLTELESERAQWQRDRKAAAVERLFAGAEYPDLLAAKVDLEAVELMPDGSVQDGAAIVARLRRQYAGLFRVPNADAGAQGTAATGADMNTIIRAQVGRA